MRRRKIISTLIVCTQLLGSILALLSLCGTPIMGVSAVSYTSIKSAETVRGAENDAHLSVSLHYEDSLQNVPSCEHTFTTIKIENTHDTEEITINGLQTHPTSGDGDRDEAELSEIQGSTFGGRTLKLEPNSYSLLPITILPQFPYYPSYKSNGDEDPGMPAISKKDAIELGYILEKDPFIVGRDKSHHTSASILVHSSRGDVLEPVEATATRSNPYHLPHTITFERDGYVSTDSIFDNMERKAFRKSTNRNRIAYEYDLYMDNPNLDKFLNVVDIFPSNPEFISIDFMHRGGRQYLTDQESSDRFNNCGMNKLEIVHCNMPMTAEVSGPLRIQPGGSRAYLGTVKLNREWLESDHEDYLSLGYVHIKAGTSFLTIAIDFNSGDGGNENDNITHSEETDEDEPISTATPNTDVKSVPTISNLRSKFTSAEDDLYHCDVMKTNSSEIFTAAEQLINADSSSMSEVKIPAQGTSVPIIDFGLMTTLGEKRFRKISVTNLGDLPIRMMHQKIDFTSEARVGDESQVTWFDRTFDKNKYPSSGAPTFSKEFNNSQIILPGQTVRNLVKVSLKSDFVLANKEAGRSSFDGSVTLRFGYADQSLDEWKEFVSMDPYNSQTLVVKLPISVSMVQGRVTYDASKLFYPAMQNQDSNKKECSNFFDRKIRIMNNFTIPLTLRSTSMRRDYKPASDELPWSICDEHFDIRQVSTKNITAALGENWIDIIVRYKYLGTSFRSVKAIKEMKSCTLVLGTDLVGDFHIPLTIFKGSVVAKTEESISPEECRGRDSLTGLECIGAIKDSTHVGSFLNDVMNRYLGTGEKSKIKTHFREEIFDGVGSYFSSLANGSKAEQISFEPIVASFGFMGANEVKTHSFFITNQNPVPVDITSLTSSMEGMELRLARIPASLDEYFRLQKQFGIGKHMLDIRSPPGEYFKTFSFRDDISLLPNATDIMKQLFHKIGTIRFHRGSFDYDEEKDNGSKVQHPPLFANETFSTETVANSPSPLLVALDHGMIYPLGTRNDVKLSALKWTIPPGGVARFEIIVRCPAKRALQNHDLGDILSTGLALKTNFGQIFPIIASYNMLSGSLKMTGINEKLVTTDNTNILPVPAIFRSMDTETENTAAEVTIQFQNTFSSSVMLSNIQSCNKWFDIRIKDSVGDIPLVIGTNENFMASVVTNLSCRSKVSGQNPSFYHCALELLEKRRSIEDSRCATHIDGFDAWTNHTTARTNAITDIKRAVAYMDKTYGYTDESVKRTEDVPFSIAHATAIANNWKVLSEFGLSIVQGVVRAEFELVDESTASGSLITSGSPSAITTTFPQKLLQTKLDFPYLSARKIDFAATAIGQVRKIYIPIKNPSGYPVRVKIFGDTESPFYLRTRRNIDHWWIGPSYAIPDERGFLLRSTHNMTIRTPGGSSLSMISPSLHATTALFHGCSGRRCGYRFPDDGSNSVYLEEQKMLSSIGASSAIGSKLIGRVYNPDGILARVPMNATSNFVDYFALDQASMKEIVVAPFSSVKIGPIYFRPASKGLYTGTLVLENNLTGYETMTIQGTGAMGKIAFFDNQENNSRGSDIELRYGRSSLIFKKRNTDDYGRSLKTLLVGNIGDIPIKVRNIYLRSPKISPKYNHFSSDRCRHRGFRMLDCDSKIGLMKSELDSRKDHFLLGKDESILVHIGYQHDCTFEKMHAELVVEYGPVEGSFPGPSSELLLSYEMGENDLRICNSVSFLVGDKTHDNGNNTKMSVMLQFWTIFIPTMMFCILLCDMIYSARIRYKSSVIFRNVISTPPKTNSKRKKTGFKNWSSAYRCLSFADPTSTELIQLGKEQSRQMLLNTYRKEGMMRPQCVQSSGAFVRERNGTSSGNSSRRNSNTMSMTLNDAIFSKCNLFDTEHIADLSPVFPGGLGWRVISGMRVNQNAENRAVRILSEKKKSTPRQVLQQKPVQHQLNKNHENDRVELASLNTSEDLQINQNAGQVKIKKLDLCQERAMGNKGRSEPTRDLPQSLNHSKTNENMSGPRTNQSVQTEVEDENVQSFRKLKDEISEKDECVVKTHLLSKDDENEEEKREIVVATQELQDSGSEELQEESSALSKSVNLASVCKSRDANKSLMEMSLARNEVEERVTGNEVHAANGQSNVSKKSSSSKDNSITQSPRRKKATKITPDDSLQHLQKADKKVIESPKRTTKRKKNSKKFSKNQPKAISTDSVNPEVSDLTLLASSPTTKDNVRKSSRDGKTGNKHTMKTGDNQHLVQNVQSLQTDKTKRRKKNKKSRLKDNQSLNSTTVGSGIMSTQPKVSANTLDQTRATPIILNEKKISDDKPQQDPSSPNGGSVRTLLSSDFQGGSNRTITSFEGSEESSLMTNSPTPDVNLTQFRPPPGLAPPPGFANGGESKLVNEEDERKDMQAPTVPSLDAIKKKPVGSSEDSNHGKNDALLAEVLNGTNALTLEPLEEGDSPDSPLIGVGQDVNVMNFLGFLDESIDNDLENENDNDNDERQIQVEDASYGALPLYGGLSYGVASNPWSGARTPRAFTYGFGVEEDDGVDSKNEGEVVDIALLTPGLILGYQPGADSDTEKENGSGFDADTFFSDLLA